ncbi:MAG: methylated-DNA--[protein]-cysteine S-methyltransferase [Pseudanabaena sp. M57BS1SP1A06MG]|nr:methylated-DNA--[protein]-cysteine S-methyltransferase [Pseudanabaena sp. M53BS1SP1A06MG]MCA6582466.1 methylated-DNA--[protein]-cysteine S-methyltransferase [Pseudanabaena sp. M34BS1SP1A06MG]MCA6593997.1 methylated-DNA--[protein]-cysteine S-methyltransferase [Pseudanabaena sp. M38BS1SP1A06MG]MCA6600506.1 methylated-DNA--[protein]-cysteine S-methyltransferase [Pseudanabaena sp. M57BS1SP1A06MG]
MDKFLDENMGDRATYELMAKAIAFILQNHRQQPYLAAIAQQVHLSEYHFQRLFTKWAGISPKRFLQYLTVEYAKSKIAETKNLLELTGDVGLSSSGRLHDLFVNLEAMSPQEFKTGGAGLEICYGIHETMFGDCLIATTERGICNLYFLDGMNDQAAELMLREEWSNAEIISDRQITQPICDRLFSHLPNLNNTKQPPLKVYVKGTNSQIQVWRALLRIPFGGITTYQGLGRSLGRPNAARVIGNAVGSNPISFLIPCHRVIRESGELGGYRWGLERKTAILGWEASHH